MKKFFLFLLLVFLSSCAFSASQIPEEFKPFKQFVSFDSYCTYNLSTYNYDYKNNTLSIDVECDIFGFGFGEFSTISQYDKKPYKFAIISLKYNLTTNELKSKYIGYITQEYTQTSKELRTAKKNYYYNNDITKLNRAAIYANQHLEFYKDNGRYSPRIKLELKLIKDYMDRKIHTIDELDSF